MNYYQLQREIDFQNEWADELARHPEWARDDHEPSDSLRRCLAQDDMEAGD